MFWPAIASQLSSQRARAAFEYAASGQQFGKVVISLED
jgi:hypothetical protein